MKITKLKLRKLEGTFKSNGVFWEERLVRPIDIYPEYSEESHENSNLQSGEIVNTPEKRTIHFKMSKDLFKKLNNEEE